MNAWRTSIYFGLVLCLLVVSLLGTAYTVNAQPIDFIKTTGQASVYTAQGAVGDDLLLTLPTNPSTGFEWQVEFLPSCLHLQERHLIEEQPLQQAMQPSPAQGTVRVGAPKQERVIFRAVNSGQGTLVLSYRRSWEQGVLPIRTVIAFVDVR